MESLTRLVSESLARHGFDRPLDYRRLHWSRWFRCESHRSLLSVPSKPGVFRLSGRTELGGCPNAVRIPAHARCRQVLRRRRHGLHSRPYALLAKSHARPPGVGTLFHSLRRNRRSGPAPQHLQRLESMDRLIRRNCHRHRHPFCFFAGIRSERNPGAGARPRITIEGLRGPARRPRRPTPDRHSLPVSVPFGLLKEGYGHLIFARPAVF
jgi:hypothetical protein